VTWDIDDKLPGLRSNVDLGLIRWLLYRINGWIQGCLSSIMYADMMADVERLVPIHDV
jgi:hypothetical protein